MNNIPGKAFSQKDFINVPKENNMIYTWVWNSPISRELIDSQLDEFKKAGIGGLYILPLPKNFRPKTMKSYMEPEYLGDKFFALAGYAIKKANQLGMQT